MKRSHRITKEVTKGQLKTSQVNKKKSKRVNKEVTGINKKFQKVIKESINKDVTERHVKSLHKISTGSGRVK